MFLLDTNVISELRKGQRCNRNVAAWWATVEGADLYLSVLVLGEIRRGIERARPRDPTRARLLERWLERVYREFSGRILTIDRMVADEWGRISAARNVPVVDALLAASARVHGMTLVTRNVTDVHGLGAATLDPFRT
jgi:hypothetical protein